jgi:sec-independent protein translocase protein TatB
VFNITGGELVIILLLALIVLGPDKLPDFVRRAGRVYAEIRKMTTGFKTEFRDVVDEPLREMRETANMAKSWFDEGIAEAEADTDLNSDGKVDTDDLVAAEAEAGADFDDSEDAADDEDEILDEPADDDEPSDESEDDPNFYDEHGNVMDAAAIARLIESGEETSTG